MHTHALLQREEGLAQHVSLPEPSTNLPSIPGMQQYVASPPAPADIPLPSDLGVLSSLPIPPSLSHQMSPPAQHYHLLHCLSQPAKSRTSRIDCLSDELGH